MRLAWLFAIRTLLLTLGLTWLTVSYAQSDQLTRRVPPPEESQEALIGRLLERTAGGGTVRIIARLSMPYQLEDALPPEARRRQRDAIAGIGGRLARGILAEAAATNRVRAFTTIPFYAAEVGHEELTDLLKDDSIAGIQEDKLFQLDLASSTQTIGADALWQAGYDGGGQVVAVLDTGVMPGHPFLSGAIVSEACFSSNYAAHNASSLCPGGATSSTAPGAGADCSGATGCGHGTHVAGIVAGDSLSLRGVAPGAGIIAVKIFSRFDSTQYCSSAPCVLAYNSDIVSGLEHVHLLRSTFNIAAVNMSLGGGSYAAACDSSDPFTTTAINNLHAAGIATVIASGNNGYTSSIASPACITNAVSVGATSKTSPVSVSSYSNSSNLLDLLAPGSSIYSSTSDGGFGYKSGTSMATPHVAGAFAILRQRFPSESTDQLIDRLKNTGVPVTDGRNGLTKPLIDISAAAAGDATDYLLNVSVSGPGKVSSAPGGIDCGATCSARFSPGTSVTLTAAPNIGASIAGWSGACSGSNATCMITLSQNASTNVSFAVPLVLNNGVTGLTATSGSETHYFIDVPAGAKDLSFSISGGTGDADLYVKAGTAPTLQSYDCRPYLSGNAEVCAFATPTTGRYHAMLHGFAAYSGVVLTATYTAPAVSNEKIDFTVSSVSIPGNQNGVDVMLRRTGSGGGSVVVGYETTNGTAIAGQDYVNTRGSLSWPSGDLTEKPLRIPLLANPQRTGPRTFSIRLTSINGGTFGANTAINITLLLPTADLTWLYMMALE